jgi:protein-tyrosine phosphatase
MTSILVLCTGNVCRSPIAEGMLRALLGDRFGASAPSVASAGMAGWEGSGADPSSVAAAAELGVDIASHRARHVDVDEVLGSTLVLAMAGEHRDQVCRLLPGEAGKTFTLKELVRLLESLPQGPSAGDPDEVLSERVAEADALRRGTSGDVARRDEDVTDPLGRRMWTFRAVAADLQEWCGRLVDGLFGPVPAWAEAEEV